MSRERARALASSPSGSSTSQVCRLFYLFQRTRAELLKTESSSTIRSPPLKLLPQPLTPDAKWRRLWAAAAMSRERARALASSPVVSSTSPASAVHKSPPHDSSPLKNYPRRRIMRQQAGKAAGRSYRNSSRSGTSSSSSLVKILP